jgi:hypothetical protein
MFNIPASPLCAGQMRSRRANLSSFTRKGCGNLDYTSPYALCPSFFPLPALGRRAWRKTTTGRAGLPAF